MVVVVVIVILVVVLSGIDTSKITGITETVAITFVDGDSIVIEDEYYWVQNKFDDTMEGDLD